MKNQIKSSIENIFITCKRILGSQAWDTLISKMGMEINPTDFPETVKQLQKEFLLPDYLSFLAQAESSIYKIQHSSTKIPASVETLQINPTLNILHVPWRIVATLNSKNENIVLPEQGEEWALIWRDPKTEKTKIKSANKQDLLALKIVTENIDPKDAAASGDLNIWNIHTALQQSVDSGLLLKPSSKIVRDESFSQTRSEILDRFYTAPYFTLQWHITHTCDLHCKHCYDRSKRSPLTFKQGLSVLDDLWQFCQERFIKGHVCFSGGNPLLSPVFYDLYQAAADRGFSTSILGNPAPNDQIEKIAAIQHPSYFQVSLEGLAEHNDFIRGGGNFYRVLEFLGVLRDCKMKSAVMLTLTKDNMDQILPLAEKLRGHADMFTFNRLSPVGEGANLLLPEKDAFHRFLKDFTEASKINPILNLKDNLLNIIREEQDENLVGGCTGFGCGAAFSFLAVLPDGETHACRKFPSPVGNLLKQTIGEIYDSKNAKAYRKNIEECQDCKLCVVCRGCMAVVSGMGGDPFKDRDPFCWK